MITLKPLYKTCVAFYYIIRALYLQVLVRRWDPAVEDITEEGITPDTVQRIKESMSIHNYTVNFPGAIFFPNLVTSPKY